METPALPYPPDETWTQQPPPAPTEPEAELMEVCEAEFEGKPVWICESCTPPMFVVAHLMRILGMKRIHRQIQSIPQGHKKLCLVTFSEKCLRRFSSKCRKTQKAWMVDSTGADMIVLNSRRPEAARLIEFLFNRLDTIRRFGRYPAPPQGLLLNNAVVPVRLAPWCPDEEAFRKLPVPRQILIAQRLEVFHEVDRAPHMALTARCRAARRRLPGFSAISIYRGYKRWCAGGKDWRTADTRFENSGRRKKIEQLTQETAV